jgi:trimeric autotransporter adhesin
MKKSTLIAALLVGAFLSGCGNSIDGSSGNSGTSVNAPVAGNFAFSALGNSQTVKGSNVGLLTGGTLNGAILLAVQSPTAKGGTVSALADGGYTYNAPLGVTGTDTFQYEIANAGGRSVGTVTVTLTGTGFFVNNQAAAGGTGTQAAPFQNLAQVQAAAAGVAGAEIVVFQGDGTSNGYNTPFSLGTNQQLHGFSSSATPVLTGPISFSSGNKLEDVRIFSTPGGVSAVNAVGASNGSINRVTIANSTSAGNCDNATGTWTISNSTVSNLTGFGFASSSSVGTLNWTVSNSTFNNLNPRACSVCEEPTGTASQNLTVTGCTFTNSVATFAGPSTIGTAVGLNVNNCTVSGGGVSLRGFDHFVQGTTAFTGILTGNNVTGCTGEGILMISSGTSTNRVKLASNRTLGNQLNRGTVVAAGTNSALCAVFQNNTSDTFELNQVAPATFSIEQLATFANRNTGAILTAGTITDVTLGTCGLP